MEPRSIDDKRLTRQITILQLSDLHFGRHHRFNPPPTAAGDVPPRDGYPTLLEKLSERLDQPDPNCPVIVCITGDVCETGSAAEFAEAERFLRGLASRSVFGRVRSVNDVYVVPGNHDVKYDGATPGERLTGYAQFLGSLTGAYLPANDPWNWPLVHDRTEDGGFVVVTLNSSVHVEKGKPDEDRGHLDVKQLGRLDALLRKIPADRLRQAIKIAIIHHHPVLIPGLAEPGRGYDAVHNSGKLLSILRRHGFHVVLHGHKHDPFVFTEDSKSAFRKSSQHPILIAGGGSLGSNQLPPNRLNCYHELSIKWHPAAGQARIVHQTIALNVFDEDGFEALPSKWTWTVLRREDLHFLKGECVPSRCAAVSPVACDEQTLAAGDRRPQEYSRLRGNMVCIDVRPSLIPSQGYEAVVWLTPHTARGNVELPGEVQWSAGPAFRAVLAIRREQDTRFCATFDYWGAMLIQARLAFEDGVVEYAFLYARMPEDCSTDSPAQ